MNTEYTDINIYPQDIQPIIQILLNHEKEFTGGYTYNDNVGDKEVVEFLTTVAYQLLTEVKKALENQIPMWDFKEGQFSPVKPAKIQGEGGYTISSAKFRIDRRNWTVEKERGPDKWEVVGYYDSSEDLLS